MESAFYFYTILIMLICIAATMVPLSAYFVSQRKSYLFIVSFFFFYFLDLALIFQYEYLGQNTSFPMEIFYSIDQPALKTLFALGTLESLWLIVCDYLNKTNFLIKIFPAVLFALVSFLAVALIPEGAFKQFIFYSLRQLFIIGILAYALISYLRTKTEVERIRLHRQKNLFIITAILTACILLEDILMILVWTPDTSSSAALLPLYISERNFSENFLMLAFAFFTLKEASATLQLRFQEPPSAANPSLQQHINTLLPAFCNRHKLTAREQEILYLVISGKDNQNIASELHLALGTVKAHTHNILKKTGHPSRQELVKDFWKE